MELISFTTPKAGIEDSRNEDSCNVHYIDENDILAVMSDGASTGVFSKEWSRHLTRNFKETWLDSTLEFENGLSSLRESFKPEISRPTALRKFLMEGSYATLLAAHIKRFSDKFDINVSAIGDVCIFICPPGEEPEYSFPYKTLEEFDNVPNLIRSSTKLQEKTPYTIYSDSLQVPADNMIVIATDALSEFIFNKISRKKTFETLNEIILCSDNNAFKELITSYRNDQNMKNDDVTISFISEKSRKIAGMEAVL